MEISFYIVIVRGKLSAGWLARSAQIQNVSEEMCHNIAASWFYSNIWECFPTWWPQTKWLISCPKSSHSMSYSISCTDRGWRHSEKGNLNISWGGPHSRLLILCYQIILFMIVIVNKCAMNGMFIWNEAFNRKKYYHPSIPLSVT